jgi:hypothetical protein
MYACMHASAKIHGMRIMSLQHWSAYIILLLLAADDLLVDELKCDELDFAMEINVRNVGEMIGDHVVMLLWSPPGEAVARGAPRKQLVGFERIQRLHPGEEQNVVVGLNVCKHLSYANARASKVVTAGMHTIATEKFEHRILVGGTTA